MLSSMFLKVRTMPGRRLRGRIKEGVRGLAHEPQPLALREPLLVLIGLALISSGTHKVELIRVHLKLVQGCKSFTLSSS
jgi:hypothetical protein